MNRVPTEQCDRTRLMIADDDPVIRRLFQSIVSEELSGVTVDACRDGVVAVECFREHHHGVLVMDLHMPLKDGLRAFEEIEEFCGSTGLSVPSVIFCTAFTASTRVRSIVEGNRRHCLLRKPVTANQLMAAIRVRLSGIDTNLSGS